MSLTIEFHGEDLRPLVQLAVAEPWTAWRKNESVRRP